MRYKGDHIRVMKALSITLPKRGGMNTEAIVARGFKGQDNAERRARNAYRMLRRNGHVEIGERGEYKLTSEGGKFVSDLSKSNWKLPERAKPEKKSTKAKPEKKSTKAKAKAKPEKKSTKATKPSKRAEKVTKKANGEKHTRKAAGKEAASKKPSNGVKPSEIPVVVDKSEEKKTSSSQLTF